MTTIADPGPLIDAIARRRTLAQIAATRGVALDIAWCLRRPAPGHQPGWHAEPYAGSLATGGYPNQPLLVWPSCERGRGLLAWHRAGNTLAVDHPSEASRLAHDPRYDW